MRNRHLFVRFTKIDEEKREAAGRLTQEMVDRDGEIWDYASSVPHIKTWSQGFDDATDGKSLGNLRAMHRPISAGKLTAIEFNDTERAVDIVAKVVDDAEWEKVKEGVYTGFSIGGNVVRSWRDATDPKHKRFEVKPVEASLADLPAVPTATFSYVKTGGVIETRHFRKVKAREDVSPKEGEDKYGDVAFADPKNKKYPIDTKAHVRAALSYWGQQKNRDKYSAEDQAAIGKRIRAAAAKFGIDAGSEKALLRGDFNKGLYEVSQLAQAVQSLAWLQQSAKNERDMEGDDSPVPDQLCDAVEDLLETLEDMLGEEGAELLRLLGADVADDDDDDDSTTEGMTMPDKEKVANGDEWKKLAAKHVQKLSSIHDKMKAAHTMLGEACDKVAGFADEVGGKKDDGTTDDDEPTEKVARTEYEKVAGERNDFEKRLQQVSEKLAAAEAERDSFKKTAEELAVVGEELLAASNKRKGFLRGMSRADDAITTTTEPTKETVKVVTAEPGTVDRGALHASFKKSFTRPQIETGLPQAS
jgi:hypothetical protein